MGEAERIGKAIREKLGGRSQEEEEEQEEGVGVCYVKKHDSQIESQGWEEEEAIRMLIRGYDERHSLCLSFCHAEFHVYSKRGWFSFSPRQMRSWWRSEIKAGVGGLRLLWGGLFFTDHQLMHLFLAISFLSPSSTLLLLLVLPLLLRLLFAVMPQELLIRRRRSIPFPSTNSSSLLSFSHSSSLSSLIDHFTLL